MDVEHTKATNRCEVLTQMNMSLEEDRRSLMDQVHNQLFYHSESFILQKNWIISYYESFLHRLMTYTVFKILKLLLLNLCVNVYLVNLFVLRQARYFLVFIIMANFLLGFSSFDSISRLVDSNDGRQGAFSSGRKMLCR